MLKVSHEVPLAFLEKSREFNDYDYALVHLFDVYPEYKKFYQDSVKMGRDVLLDNSAFELGVSVCEDILLRGVRDINPTYVVAPDKVGNYKQTIKKTTAFIETLGKETLEKVPEVIGVIQGKSFMEYVACYTHYKVLGLKYIAIPFDVKIYPNILNNTTLTKAHKYGLSRVKLIQDLLTYNIIDKSIKHHLLGCGDPIEFVRYKDLRFQFLHSVDTSCPVILGMFLEKLGESGLGKEKRLEKLADNLEMIIDPKREEIIRNNVKTFRKYIR